MASGWGITGNKGRCYDFWMDFSDCMSRCREPKDCTLLREDYFECLHHSKETSVTALVISDDLHPPVFGRRYGQRSSNDAITGRPPPPAAEVNSGTSRTSSGAFAVLPSS
ncbi:NADH dehydrogenase [Striga hermonthica]|uniref:NADH dehydrogenase [ubiquinone] iron-sulfur protein 5 n=1 Tax=Striga hermonthica TaxID=68872 RepID=A0A9N7R9W3_STRHE|nr:NADH dehydrogenase [Striga hermonthica]